MFPSSFHVIQVANIVVDVQPFSSIGPGCVGILRSPYLKIYSVDDGGWQANLRTHEIRSSGELSVYYDKGLSDWDAVCNAPERPPHEIEPTHFSVIGSHDDEMFRVIHQKTSFHLAYN